MALALKRGGYLPVSGRVRIRRTITEVPPPGDVIIDGAKRPVHQDQEEQQEKSSGKKKAHTVKHLVLVDESSRRREYLSPTVGGKHHDQKLAHESKLTLPPGISLLKDKSFEGYKVPGACNC